jgi:GT2 family glycosyltransferase
MPPNTDDQVLPVKPSRYYDAYYFQTGCGLPYNHNEKHWQQFFGAIAGQIVADFQPGTVLDAGCAMGFLVEALRRQNVEAYGVDISEYAIENVAETVRPYCEIRSVTQPLTRSYDLIVCIEVLEHLFPQEAAKAIANFCHNTEEVLFSSTPFDFKEATHFNVQPPDYWAEIFARNGFYRDVDYDASFLTPWAVRFRKKNQPFGRIVSAYERRFWTFDKQIQATRTLALENRQLLADKEIQLSAMRDSLAGQEKAQQTLLDQLAEKDEAILTMAAQKERAEQTTNEFLAFSRIQEQAIAHAQADKALMVATISAAKERTVEACRQEVELRHHLLEDAVIEKARAQAEIEVLKQQLADCVNSRAWKLALKIRGARQKLLPVGSRRARWLRASYQLLKTLKSEGPKAAVVKSLRKLTQETEVPAPATAPAPAFPTPELFAEAAELVQNTVISAAAPYDRWIQLHEPSAAELDHQRQTVFPYRAKISVVVPTYNTPTRFLVAMINSVLKQTYTDWELCIADGSHPDHPARQILHYYSQRESRIKVRFLEENLGIAGNSNAALALASGEFIALLDHDDTLAPFALYEINCAICIHYRDVDFIYSDEDKINEAGDQRSDPHMKPDWSPDTLRSHNYICHLSVFRGDVIRRIGGFAAGFDGSQDYDLILRATEQARRVVHIPKILYHWRNHQGSCASAADVKLYAYESAKKALQEHLDRSALKGSVQNGITLGVYQVNLKLTQYPLVSILIPNHNSRPVLERCIESIRRNAYPNYEIILVENGSTKPEIFDYYEELTQQANVRVVEWKGSFNYSAVNNFAAEQAKGEVLLFLNNDIEAISFDWIERMLQYAQRPDVGAVGAKLYYPDNTIQHGGVILGLGGVAGHAHHWYNRSAYGYFGRLIITQNLSAVTAACLMVRRRVFEEAGGFDERFTLAFNDVDLCIKIRRQGRLIVWTPYAELYHHESLTRGEDDTPEKRERFRSEVQLFVKKWYPLLEKGDPYYNPNLTLLEPDFSLRVQEADPVERLKGYLYV